MRGLFGVVKDDGVEPFDRGDRKAIMPPLQLAILAYRQDAIRQPRIRQNLQRRYASIALDHEVMTGVARIRGRDDAFGGIHSAEFDNVRRECKHFILLYGQERTQRIAIRIGDRLETRVLAVQAERGEREGTSSRHGITERGKEGCPMCHQAAPTRQLAAGLEDSNAAS